MLKISCPSKTFLFGEYSALTGGAAVVLGTIPRFNLNVSRAEGFSLKGFSEFGPHKVCFEDTQIWQGWQLEFEDPHSGKGGLGASTAQYLLSWMAMNLLRQETLDYKRCFETYKRQTLNTKGASPSGYDVLGQLYGGCSLIESSGQQVTSLEWPFSEFGFFIVRGWKKVATHDHLANLFDRDFTDLKKISNELAHHFLVGNGIEFLEGMNSFSSELIRLNCVAQETNILINSVKEHVKFLAAKGCGAMGSDTVLFLVDKKGRQQAFDVFNKLKLEVLATEAELEKGLTADTVELKGRWRDLLC